MAEYGSDGSRQVLESEPDRTAEGADSAPPDGAPEPWYRNRVLLALWALMVALLLALVIYGIVELSRGGGETTGPATTTSSTTSTSAPSSTTSPTTTPSTATETSAPPETPEQTPEEVPPPPAANNSPAPAEPPQHQHHHPHVPSTITLPHTVVTLPHGF
jgi:outer membrane biosynthesis protein TonB